MTMPETEESCRLLHELQVHQAELEVQNEELKEARVALEDALGKYSGLFHRAPIGYIIHDDSGRIQEMNEAAAELLGVAKKRALGAFLHTYIDHRDLQDFQAFRQRCRKSARREDVELRLRTKAAAVPTHLYTSALSGSDQGTLFQTALIDLSERKKTELKLVRAKEEWERTFDSVPDLIAIMDSDHRIVRANKAMAQRLGVTPDECAGRVCYLSVHGADEPIDNCPHVLTLADGREHQAEVHEERLGGYFLVTTTPLMDERGEMIGTVHVARDITERKRAEEQIQRHVEELQAANAELTRFNTASVGRELRMIELKKKVNEFCEKSGEPPLYPLDFDKD